MNKIKPLSFLPNQDSFEFVGIKKDDVEIDCKVIFSLEGQHIVVNRYTNERIFNQLKGWK